MMIRPKKQEEKGGEPQGAEAQGAQIDSDTDAAMMAAIAASADADIDGAVQAMMPGQAEAEPEPKVNQAEQIGALLTMGVMMGAPALPFLPKCYTPEVVGRIAQAAAAVCDKYGWQVGDVMTPELALAVAVLPPSVQAWVMWKQHKAEQEAQRQREQASGAHGAAQVLPMGAATLTAPVSMLAGERVMPGA